jgi:hypothetical protein
VGRVNYEDQFTDFAARVKDEAREIRIRREARRMVDAEDAEAARPPEPAALDVLLAEPDDDTPMIVDELARQGTVILLTAARKAGKSTVIFNLARALADGSLFLGRYRASLPDGRVGLIDFELPRDTARRWLRAMNVGHPERVEYWGMRGAAGTFAILEDTGRKLWAARLRTAGIAVLIVDCLTPLILALGLDENTEAGQLIEALKALQAEAGLAAVVAVHHEGWNGQPRARGDSKLEGLPDDLWRLRLADPDDLASAREFSAAGWHIGVAPVVLTYLPAMHTLTVNPEAGPARRGRRPAAADQREQMITRALEVIGRVYGNSQVPGLNATWMRVRGEDGCPARMWVEEAVRRLRGGGDASPLQQAPDLAIPEIRGQVQAPDLGYPKNSPRARACRTGPSRAIPEIRSALTCAIPAIRPYPGIALRDIPPSHPYKGWRYSGIAG